MTNADALARARAQYASLLQPVNSLEEARLLMEASVKDDPIPNSVSIIGDKIGGIAIERMTPAKAKAGVIIFVHGGGYMAGSLVTHRAVAAEIAAATGRMVVPVDYRRAPEHFFPAAVEDVAAVYAAIRKEQPAGTPIAFVGDSAGGGLVVSVVKKLQESGAILPQALILIGPWIDLRLTGKSFEINKDLDPIVTAGVLGNSAMGYVGPGDKDHPWLAPLQVGVNGFPPMLIHVGSAEGLLDDSINLADRARADGVDVKLEVWPDMMHTWHRYAAYLPQAREALAAIGTFVEDVFSGARAKSVSVRTALGTPQQIAAEKLTLKLLNHPDIKAAQAKVRQEVQSYSFAKMQGAQESLDHALTKWTVALLMRELAADPVDPAILWYIEDTPYQWHGFEFPTGSGMGDNPDQVYRITFLDGAGRYEIKGKLAAVPPVHYLFEVNRAGPGLKIEQPAAQSNVDMGNQVSILNNLNLKVEPDGSFRIVLGGDAADAGPNHLALAPGINEISIREVFNDWNERPAHLEVRRLTPPTGKALDEAEIIRRSVIDLSTFVHFWFGGNEQWMGNAPSNAVRGPNSRDGGWGFLGAARFKLKPGEAIVVTLDPCGAKYMGLHITDPWMSIPDGRVHRTSLNKTQVISNTDGSVTYAVGPEDPGVANWIDSAGFYEGTSIFRWVDTPPGAAAEKLVRQYDVMKISDIQAKGLAGGPVTPEERRAQRARRAVDIAKRRG